MHRYELCNDPTQFLVGMFRFKSEYISLDSISTEIWFVLVGKIGTMGGGNEEENDATMLSNFYHADNL